MFPKTEALYKELTTALGLESLNPDPNGTVQLEVGDDSLIYIFAETAENIMLVSAVMELPLDLDYGRMLWLMKQNFYNSPITPFHIACDNASNIIIWGRVPVEAMTGEQLAGLIDALGEQSDLIREELATDEVVDESDIN